MFDQSVLPFLRRAGWSGLTQITEENCIKFYRKAAYEPTLSEALLSLYNIVIEYPNPRNNEYVEKLDFRLKNVLKNNPKEFSDFDDAFNSEGCFPVAMLSHMTVVCDNSGAYFGIFDDTKRHFGNSIEEAIVTIITGRSRHI